MVVVVIHEIFVPRRHDLNDDRNSLCQPFDNCAMVNEERFTTNRMHMVDGMMVMVVLRFMIVLVIVWAQFEEVRQRREQEQYEFEQQLFGSRYTDNQWQQPEQFDFDEFDDQHNGQKWQQQFMLEEFLCVRANENTDGCGNLMKFIVNGLSKETKLQVESVGSWLKKKNAFINLI